MSDMRERAVDAVRPRESPLTDYADLEKRLRASILESLDVFDEAALKTEAADAIAALEKQYQERDKDATDFALEVNRLTRQLEEARECEGLADANLSALKREVLEELRGYSASLDAAADGSASAWQAQQRVDALIARLSSASESGDMRDEEARAERPAHGAPDANEEPSQDE